ncbi:hypothetical protein [Nocardioides sp. CER19]|uniref:hypothetical protein n=1 Tax=Nocardioides sp. CER19 TaxID=3038538 RepID=UPI0024496B19|nr:hypothetical protein [Nocardioides sp. CER19]MDH2416512.1 hypothetical protein [Nocardioides sp. CER19]
MRMPSRALGARLLGVFSVLLAVVLATGQGAYAASKTVRDATGDTYSIAGDTPVRKASAIGDIVSVRTAHRAKKVIVVIRTRGLAAVNAGFVQIKTSNPGRQYFVSAFAAPGMKSVSLTKGMNSTNDLTCRGLRAAFQIASNTITVQVPRTCLHSPRWVRTGVLLTSTSATETDDGYVDVAGLDVVSDNLWNDDSASLPLGPKVRRG